MAEGGEGGIGWRDPCCALGIERYMRVMTNRAHTGGWHAPHILVDDDVGVTTIDFFIAKKLSTDTFFVVVKNCLRKTEHSPSVRKEGKEDMPVSCWLFCFSFISFIIW